MTSHGSKPMRMCEDKISRGSSRKGFILNYGTVLRYLRFYS
jgi:hypothetical protein